MSSSFGNVVIIDYGAASDGNVYTLYAHGSERHLNDGDAVNEGDLVISSGKPFTSDDFGIPNILNTITPLQVQSTNDFGRANLILLEQDIISR